MKRKDEIKDFYNEFSKNLIRDRIYPNPRHKKIINYLKEVFKDYKFKSALEIGCGIGIISEYIAKNVENVSGIDISEENIKFAKTTVKYVNFYCSDFLEYQMENKFDLITLFDVLEHIPKEIHQDVFKRISEISNTNTIILVTIPDPYYLNHIKQNNPEKLQVVDESIYLIEILRIFNQYNLEVLTFEKYGIDYADQYNFYMLRFKNKNYKLNSVSLAEKKFLLILIEKLFNRIKKIYGQFRYRKYLK